MKTLTAFLVGSIFAVGLALAGMTQPDKIIGFLDFFGSWDATLLFVMMGAVVMYFVFYRVVRGTAPILTEHFQIPTKRQIDRRLLIGASMFGAGWGLAGFCPGPALASIGHGAPKALLFVGAMLAGMYLFVASERLRARLARNAARRVAEPAVESASSRGVVFNHQAG